MYNTIILRILKKLCLLKVEYVQSKQILTDDHGLKKSVQVHILLILIDINSSSSTLIFSQNFDLRNVLGRFCVYSCFCLNLCQQDNNLIKQSFKGFFIVHFGNKEITTVLLFVPLFTFACLAILLICIQTYKYTFI